MLKFDMKLTWNGRKVTPNQLAREMTKSIEKSAMSIVDAQVRERVEKLRCPIHGTGPRVETTRTMECGSDPGWKAYGCCEELTSLIRTEFGAEG